MTLDEAWAAAEAALPEGWAVTDVLRRGGGAEREWRAFAHRWTPYADPINRVAGMGPTPAEALIALAVELRKMKEQA